MTPTQLLLQWYATNQRPLAWRETREPYKIWLSEVILQQTRVAQGTNYYHRFLSAFPDVMSLAGADEQDVLKLWQGLGYYSRARNMHYTAKEIVEKHNGVFPHTAAELKKLKGIGDYTAAAIASICFNEAVAVLDGNVARVISRLFAVENAVDSALGRSQILELATAWMDTNHAGQYNQALMELGAVVCIPQNPKCKDCPLVLNCEAFKLKTTELFPVKTPKKLPSKRFLNYLIFEFAKDNVEYLLMRKRTENDIWKNLYDFPCIETETATETETVIGICIRQKWLYDNDFQIVRSSAEFLHQLTHRTLIARFIVLRILDNPQLEGEIIAVKKSEIHKLPLPRLIDRYISSEI